MSNEINFKNIELFYHCLLFCITKTKTAFIALVYWPFLQNRRNI